MFASLPITVSGKIPGQTTRGPELPQKRLTHFLPGVRLNIMSGSHNISSILPQNLNPPLHLITDHLRRAIGQQILNINTTEKYKVLPEILLQVYWIHTRCQRLYGIQNIKAKLNKIGDDRNDGPTAMPGSPGKDRPGYPLSLKLRIVEIHPAHCIFLYP